MRVGFFNQKGFILPPLLAVALVILGVGGLGTATAANSARPGDVLFGLDQTIEELRVKVTGGDFSKAEVRLEIAKERLSEFDQLAAANQLVDAAVTETQQAVTTATQTVSEVEVKFKENKITLKAADLQALLQELQVILANHQGLIRGVEVRIKDDEIRAKVKFFEQEASESAELIEDDLDDLEDDGLLNASTAQTLEIELKGTLTKSGTEFQLTSGGKTYTLMPSAGVNLDDFSGKLVELEGFAQNSTPTQVTVSKIEIEDEDEETDEIEVKGPPEVEARGIVKKSGGAFILTTNGKTLYNLTSKLNLNNFVDKFVEAEGTLSGNTLNVLEIEVKKTKDGKPVTPALSTSDEDEEDENDDKDKSGSSGSGSSGSSNSGSSGSNGGKGSN